MQKHVKNGGVKKRMKKSHTVEQLFIKDRCAGLWAQHLHKVVHLILTVVPLHQ